MGIQLTKSKGGHIYLENPMEELMEMLVEKTLALGHMVSFREACEDPELVDPNSYAFYYGSFSEAAKIAWKKANNPHRDKSDKDSSGVITISKPNSKKPSYDKVSNRKPHNYTNPNVYKGPLLGKHSEQSDTESYLDDDGSEQPVADYASKKHLNKTRGRARKYTYESLKKALVDFYKETGRLPKQNEVTANANLPSWATLYKVLGNREEWYRIIKTELLKEGTLQAYSEEPIPEDDVIKVEEPPATPEAPSDNTSVLAATIKPIINIKYNWEGDTLQVEVRVVKPGNARPVYVTLSV